MSITNYVNPKLLKIEQVSLEQLIKIVLDKFKKNYFSQCWPVFAHKTANNTKVCL